MKVKFDALTPVPSPQALAEARERSQERLDRQARANAARREQLLDVAQAVIESQGLEGFNMRVIARRAGYTAGALYAYFDGKEGILLALQRRVLDRLADAVRLVKPPRQMRGARNASSSESSDHVAATLPGVEAAHAMHVAQSMAWWRSLAQDPGGFQLLLLRPSLVATSGAPATQEASFPDSSTALGELEALLKPCRDSLLACGLDEPTAYQLHRELLACGLGLLALATASGHSQLEGLEAQWHGTLVRWQTRILAPVPQPAKSSRRSAADQADLFVG